MNTKPVNVLLITLCLLIVSACATAPKLELENVSQGVTPKLVVENIDTYRTKKVLWGGVIINSINIEKGTQFEILLYPLDRYHRPQVEGQVMGRIVALYDGYLEIMDFAPGRVLTVVGQITDTKKGIIGEAEYVYPLINIEQHHLWSRADTDDIETRFHIGIGVVIH